MSQAEQIRDSNREAMVISALDSECSVRIGFCIECHFVNDKPLKAKSKMDENELIMLDALEHIRKSLPTKLPRLMLARRVNGFWANVCQPCFKALEAAK